MTLSQDHDHVSFLFLGHLAVNSHLCPPSLGRHQVPSMIISTLALIALISSAAASPFHSPPSTIVDASKRDHAGWTWAKTTQCMSPLSTPSVHPGNPTTPSVDSSLSAVRPRVLLWRLLHHHRPKRHRRYPSTSCWGAFSPPPPLFRPISARQLTFVLPPFIRQRATA